jgi:hypothetical protein
MKKAVVLFYFLAFCIVLFNSCEKIPGHLTSTTGGVTSSNYYITLKVDGVAKSSNLSVATIYTGAGSNTMQIIGQLPGTEGINLMVDSVKIGTFDVVINNAILSYSTTAAYADTFLGTTGTITISALTTDTITGTFQFTGTNFTTHATKIISSGAFNLQYIKI